VSIIIAESQDEAT